MVEAHKSSGSIRLQEGSGTWDASRWSLQENHWSVDTRRYLYIHCLGEKKWAGENRVVGCYTSKKLTWISSKSNLADTVMAAIGVDAIRVLSTLFFTFSTLVQVPTPWTENISKSFHKNQHGRLYLYVPHTKIYSVFRISWVAFACQSPGVVIVVGAFAVVATILKPVQQLLLVARALAPSPFTLWSKIKLKRGKKMYQPEPSPH